MWKGKVVTHIPAHVQCTLYILGGGGITSPLIDRLRYLNSGKCVNLMTLAYGNCFSLTRRYLLFLSFITCTCVPELSYKFYTALGHHIQQYSLWLQIYETKIFFSLL
jgi:hypothetical protein